MSLGILDVPLLRVMALRTFNTAGSRPLYVEPGIHRWPDGQSRLLSPVSTHPSHSTSLRQRLCASRPSSPGQEPQRVDLLVDLAALARRWELLPIINRFIYGTERLCPSRLLPGLRMKSSLGAQQFLEVRRGPAAMAWRRNLILANPGQKLDTRAISEACLYQGGRQMSRIRTWPPTPAPGGSYLGAYGTHVVHALEAAPRPPQVPSPHRPASQFLPSRLNVVRTPLNLTRDPMEFLLIVDLAA